MTILKKAFFLLITLLLLVGMGGSFAAGLSRDKLESRYPSAVQDGYCYLFRIDNSKVIAVWDKNSVISYLFVLGSDRSENKKVAEKLIKEFALANSYNIKNFGDADPSIAIENSYYNESYDVPSTPSELLDRCKRYWENLYYAGWSGRLLRLKCHLDNKELEILIDLSGGIKCPAIRITKGNLSRYDLVTHIGKFLGFEPYTKPPKSLRKRFTPAEALASDSPSNSTYHYNCIVRKGKVYYGGKITDVEEAVKAKLDKLPDFKYPAEEDKSANDVNSQVTTNNTPATNRNKPITIGDIKKLFPTLERLGSALEGFTLDNSRVYVVKNTDSTATTAQVAFIIVQSSQNRIDASRTASQIAQKISTQCIVKPFVDPEPAAVIFMPWVDLPMNSQYCDLLLAPYDKSTRTTQFIALKGGLLITHIKSNAPGAVGTVKATTALGSSALCDGTELEVLDGEIDIHQFLKSRGADFHPDITETERIQHCTELRCVDQILHGKGNPGASYLVIYCGNSTYRIGTYDTLKQMQTQGFVVADYFANKTAGGSSTTTGSIPPQRIPLTDEAAHTHRTGINRESAQKSSKLSPAQALKQYLEIIKSL